ncbi:MAG TPA: depupylase/deamidase Dop [Acidobacteriota bacterium]
MSIPKIIGLEQEYAVTLQGRSDFDPIQISFLLVNSLKKASETLWDYRDESPFLDARGFNASEEKEIRISHRDNYRINNLLLNGARFYVDHAHPEFSTAECRSLREAIAFDRAGERILEEAARRLGRQHSGTPNILIYKNNSDYKGNSYGCHENYLVESRVYDQIFPAYPAYPKLISQLLVPFLVTRQILCGSGKLGSENGTAACDYQISQRADFFETLIGANTTSRRPIVNSRDEPHADRKKFRRLHVIVGDANMAETSSFLKLGTMQLLLRMLEDNWGLPNLAIEDPVRALVAISHDPSCKEKIPLADGRRLSAIELQRMVCERAREYVDSSGSEADSEPREVVQLWAEVLDTLERDPMELADRLDWVAKLALIERYRTRRHHGWDSPRLKVLDIQYHDVRRGHGLYYLLEREGRIRRMLKDDALVERFVTQPPESTRAYFRSKCMEKFGHGITEANWDALTFSAGGQKVQKIRLADPLKGTRAMTEDLLQSAATPSELLQALGGRS